MKVVNYVRSWLNQHHIVLKVVRHTDHAAHIGYFGAAAFGMHEFYGYSAAVLLFVLVFNLVTGGSEA